MPREHIEALVSHPMILASVLLKLGGWAWVGVCFCVILVNLSLIGELFFSLFCMWQTDWKSLNS
jgi:NADH:ubiquinone oxidoreductase subunit 4 (subunit M)